MPSVGRQDKVAAGAPLKSLLCSIVPPNRGVAVSGDDIGCLGVHMPQRRGRSSGGELDDVLIAFVVSVQVAKRAVDSIAFARPGTHFHGFHILYVYAANPWDTFSLAPLFVHIDAHEGRLFFGISRGVLASRGNFSNLS